MKKSSRKTVLYELMAKPGAAPTQRRRPRRSWWSGAADETPTQHDSQPIDAPEESDKATPAIGAAAEVNNSHEAASSGAAPSAVESSAGRTVAPLSTQPPVQTGGSIGELRPPIQISGGAVTIRWTAQTVILLGGCCAALVLGAYWIGRASVQGGPDTPYRAIAAPGPTVGATDDATQPGDPVNGGRASSGSHAATGSRRPGDGVEQLLKPVTAAGAERTEQPATATDEKVDASSGKKQLRLWIESIRAGSAAEKRAALAEAAKIQEFLRQESIETDVETVSNGVIIISREAFAVGAAGAADREALQLRVQRLGRLYQQRGGQYSFKSCFWK